MEIKRHSQFNTLILWLFLSDSSIHWRKNFKNISSTISSINYTTLHMFLINKLLIYWITETRIDYCNNWYHMIIWQCSLKAVAIMIWEVSLKFWENKIARFFYHFHAQNETCTCKATWIASLLKALMKVWHKY